MVVNSLFTNLNTHFKVQAKKMGSEKSGISLPSYSSSITMDVSGLHQESSNSKLFIMTVPATTTIVKALSEFPL